MSRRESAATATQQQRTPLLEPREAEQIVEFVEATGGWGPAETLDWLERRLSGNERACQAIANLRNVCELIRAAGMPEERFGVDVSLARGLDYYTGIVFESTIDGFESVGSVCSGGRYDDLAGLFTQRKLPGVGASFGLDRILHIMSEAGMIRDCWTVVPVLVVWFPGCAPGEPARIAAELRAAGIACELYPEPAPLRAQIGYASSRGHRLVVIAGPDELAAGTFALRDMEAKRQERNLPRAELVEHVRKRIQVGQAPPDTLG
jgi:histidyl-tRNA synthetase